jgi:hypothetical protein
MRARLVLPVGLTVACAATPDPLHGRDPLLTVDAAAGRVEALGRAPMKFVMQLGADDGIGMPTGLFIDGENRIGRTGGCPTESGVGIAVTPAFTAVATAFGGAANLADEGLRVEWSGPVIAKLRVAWRGRYQCPGPQEAHGVSTFTIFPDGRIVRHDEATPSTSDLAGAPVCGCSSGGATSFSFTSFWTFAPGAQNVRRDGSPAAPGSNKPDGCVIYPGHMIGLAWSPPSASATRLETPGGTSAYVHDLAPLAAPTLSATPRQVSSALLLSRQTSPASCAEVLAALDGVPVLVGGMTMFPDLAGVYVDERRHAAPIEISAPRRVPPFAISLEVGDFAAVARSSPPDGDWYYLQRDGQRTLFWFRDGLDAGESITIEPR